MKNWLKTSLIAAGVGLLASAAIAWAAQTNYIGTVFVADTTTPANQLKVNADGSINVTSSGGGGGTSSTFGSAFPAAGTAAGLSDGTNMVPWKTANGLGDAATGANTGGIAAWYFNGTTWDRARGDTTNGAWVNVKTSALPTGASTAANQTAPQGTVAPGTAATASLMQGCVYNTSAPAPTNGQGLAIQCDSAGRQITVDASTAAQGSTTSGQLGQLTQGAVTTNAPSYSNGQTSPLSITTAGLLRVNIAASAGGAITGQTPADAQTNAVTAFNTAGFPFVFNGTTWDRLREGSVTGTALVSATPTTSNGLSVKRLLVANNTTSVAVDASAGQLYGIEAFNNSTVIAYVKLYNAAQGSTTCGTTTPVWSMMIPAPAAGGGGFISINPMGISFSTAISACVTTGYADNDTTAPAANAYIVNFYYK